MVLSGAVNSLNFWLVLTVALGEIITKKEFCVNCNFSENFAIFIQLSTANLRFYKKVFIDQVFHNCSPIKDSLHLLK